MDILDSSLGTQIRDIAANATTTNFFWDAEIHCAEGLTVHCFKLLNIDFVCDYTNNFTDEVTCRLAIGAGDYAYDVYPNMAKLEITLFKIPVNEVGGGSTEGGEVQTQRYTATIVKPQNPVIASNSFNQPDKNALNLTNMLEIDFQLIPKAVNQFRMRNFGGIFRNVTTEDCVRAILTSESKLIKTDVDTMPVGVQMVPGNNKTKRDHIVIPQGTRLVDVPGYIHSRCGGVYNAGFAYYFLNNTWYVFPPYNNVDFAQAQKTLTLIRVPKNRMPGTERTFKVNGDAVTAIVTGDTRSSNKTESMMLNEGNGVRFGDADKMMEDFVKVQGNKATAGRGGTNNEFTTISRPDGLNNVLNSETRISSNPFVEYSKLAFRDGIQMAMSWENSDPTLIYPGMPVKILFMEDDEIRETFGLIVHAHHYVQTLGTGFQSNRHMCTSNLVVFTKRQIDYGDDE